MYVKIHINIIKRQFMPITFKINHKSKICMLFVLNVNAFRKRIQFLLHHIFHIFLTYYFFCVSYFSKIILKLVLVQTPFLFRISSIFLGFFKKTTQNSPLLQWDVMLRRFLNLENALTFFLIKMRYDTLIMDDMT